MTRYAVKKLALAFSTKNRSELRAQSLPRVSMHPGVDLHIVDGSDDTWRPGSSRHLKWYTFHQNIRGGADAAIVYALTMMLQHEENYTHVGLLEQDVLLDEDWFEPTVALFDNAEGLSVGAVSARSYADRILIQRDGYAVMHNVGAGHVIFTREAANLILQNYRTGWWPENRSVFAQLSGLDIGKWAAFHHAEQMITADWSWDTILAAHGLATVALTPSKASMIGQDIPLEQQGLSLVQGPVAERVDDLAFKRFRLSLDAIRRQQVMLPLVDWQLRTHESRLLFPHHASKFGGGFTGEWRTRWSQGFGPFTYVAPAGGNFSVPLFGACAFHVSGGKVTLHDPATGYRTEADLSAPPESVSLAIPRDLQYGTIELAFGPGACLHGIETVRPQPWRPQPFDYSTLPPVEDK